MRVVVRCKQFMSHFVRMLARKSFATDQTYRPGSAAAQRATRHTSHIRRCSRRRCRRHATRPVGSARPSRQARGHNTLRGSGQRRWRETGGTCLPGGVPSREPDVGASMLPRQRRRRSRGCAPQPAETFGGRRAEQNCLGRVSRQCWLPRGVVSQKRNNVCRRKKQQCLYVINPHCLARRQRRKTERLKDWKRWK